MASGDVRTAVRAAVEAAAAPWDVFDLSDYVTLQDALPNSASQVVLIQYVASDEQMANIAGQGNQGWRQNNTVVLHLVTKSGQPSAAAIAKGDAIREALRGQRLTNKITIESCEPFTDFGGAVGVYGARWKGYAANMFIVRRDCG
ncbi:hypothetical protein [Parahaliea mediterranea]|uniref:hypothetical protein n=1 Tax=Parahaliea mediterranea TaxID=651086 RepID=UPI000E2ECEEB|nr:hypothetical protein [Parahaliea mediterranea]